MSSVNKADISGIPAIWVEPEGEGPKPLVIWLTGFSGAKESMEPYLLDIAAKGAIAVSFDPFEHGERLVDGTREALSERIHSNIRRYFWPILARTAEEVPTLIDWAAEKFDVQPGVRIGGISMGGDLTVAVPPLDPRVARVVAAIATPDWLRPGTSQEVGTPDAAAQAAYDRRNPLTNLEGYAHCPEIAFHLGAQDQMVPPDGAQRFIDALQSIYGEKANRLSVTLYDEVGHAYPLEMWQGCLDSLMADIKS